MFFRNLGLFVVILFTGFHLGAQCTGFIFEEEEPPAVVGMSTTDPGFRAHYWAWDDFNHRRSGVDDVLISDVVGGMQLYEIDWVHASVCDNAGPVGRTAVLFEALGPEGFGRWALVNLDGDSGGTVDVDDTQARLGDLSSRAVAVPQPTIEGIKIDDEVIEIELSWILDESGELLSDLVDEQGQPIPSVRGFAVYIINGPAATARPWDWTLADDLEVDAVNGFSTDTSASIVLPRSMWNEVVISFAIALTFDGDGDAEGELPGSRSVHGAYLGLPSPWLALPPLGSNDAVGITGFDGVVKDGRWLNVKWTADAEPSGVFYRIWIDQQPRRSVLLQRVEGGARSYAVEVELPRWCRRGVFDIRLEMVDPLGRVLDESVVHFGNRISGSR